MSKKIQKTYKKAETKIIASIGDSLTNNYVYGVTCAEYHPRRLASALNAIGCAVKPLNLGVSGDSSGMMIARMAGLVQFGVPVVGVIYAGTNDLGTNGTTAVTAATTPSTTQFSVTTGSGVRFPAGSYITINSQTVKIQARSTDLLTVAPALSSAPTTGNAVNCATRQNIVVLGEYLQDAGCNRIIIAGEHYMNYSTGGDTTTVQNATYQTLRGLQSAAATDLDAEYLNLYAYMSALITGGTDTQSSYSWHVADSNIHLNAYGEQIIADAAFGLISGKPDWVSALKT